MLLSKLCTYLSGSRSRPRSTSRSKSICSELHACFIHFFLLTEVKRSVATRPRSISNAIGNPETTYCAPSVDHASCSRIDWQLGWGCEEVMKGDNIPPGDLFNKLMKGSNCSGEFILGKTGFNMTILRKDNIGTGATFTHCETSFDPHRTWDYCSNLHRRCNVSMEVCDADRPGENCFTNNSTHLNGFNLGRKGRHVEIYSVFLDGQLPCTRCLLQLRWKPNVTTSKQYYCLPIAITPDESASTDNPDADTSGNYNTQVGHITIVFSTMFTLIIVLV